MALKKILIVSDRIPNDSSKAGAPRIFELCNALSEEFSFSYYLINKHTLEVPESAKALFKPFHQEVFIGGPQNFWGLLFRRFSPTNSFDYRVTNRSKIKEIRLKLKAFFHDCKYDAILVDGLFCSQYIHESLKSRAVLEMCDCLTKLQLRDFARLKGIRASLSGILSIVGTWFWERSELRKFRYSTIISKDELGPISFLRFRYELPSIVPLGINLEYFKSKEDVPRTHSIIFFGSLSYIPNIDAVVWLAKEILPAIQEDYPDTTLNIVGAEPANEILALSKSKGIRISSDVDDIRPHISHNAVFVSSIRLGAGVKNKTLVTISMERPVISTSIGLEGIEGSVKKGILIADSVEDFKNQLGRLFNRFSDNKEYEKLKAELKLARETLDEKLSWKKCAAPLGGILKKLVE